MTSAFIVSSKAMNIGCAQILAHASAAAAMAPRLLDGWVLKRL